jgi:hypothetical protein
MVKACFVSLYRFGFCAWIFVVCALALGGVPAYAQSYEDHGMRTLKMAHGVESISVEGTVEGWGVQKFRIPARSGQRLRLGLEGRNPSLAFNLINPITGAIVHDGIRSGRRAELVLQNGGDWVVEVFLTRAAADRWEVANFRLDVRLTAESVQPPVSNSSVANGVVIVSGLGGYGSLNIRAEASFAGFASARYLSAEGGSVPVQPPSPPVPESNARPLDVQGMLKACRDLAYEAWKIPPGFIIPSEPIAVGRGFQSSVTTLLFGFSGTCIFDSNGIILRFQ